MDEEHTISGRAFAAFAMAAISLVLAIFVLSYTLGGPSGDDEVDSPLPPTEQPTVETL